MRYLGEEEVTQVLGLGYAGQLREGPDGNLYQWVQGVDGLGNPIGFWKRLRRRFRRLRRGLRRFARRALPLVQRVASAIPLPRAGVAGYDGLGALYQAPDGTLYQVQGLAEDEELRGLAEDEESQGLGQEELTQVMGVGSLGEIAQGPDGNLYQWVQGVDGLGNPIGFWKRLRRGFRRLRRGLRRFARRALPLVQRVASAIPLPQAQAVAAGLKVATPVLTRAGVAGYDGLGALYQAPDGTLYQVQGLAEDEELRGLAEDEELRGVGEDDELRGLAEDEELRGLAEDEELRGLSEDEELRGLAEDEELRGLNEDEDLRGLDEGYVREPMSGLDAYVPQQLPQTRWFNPPSQAPEMWKPLW
jgi:hypothetical protein